MHPCDPITRRSVTVSRFESRYPEADLIFRSRNGAREVMNHEAEDVATVPMNARHIPGSHLDQAMALKRVPLDVRSRERLPAGKVAQGNG